MLYSLLLAGGKSSRMGQDKKKLTYQGKTLLEHSLHLLEQTGSDEILISGDIDGYEGLPDLIADCGPLGGIHAALHYIDKLGKLDSALLLVVPVDMPLLDTTTLAHLVTRIGDKGSCHYDGEIFPCVLRASDRLKAHLDTLLCESTELGGRRSMKALLTEFGERTISTDPLVPEVFLNVNRPADWDAFITHINRKQ